jgi:enoyl-CoA hydratase/carnithine racemase
MSQDWVRIETYDHILKITFNRPEKKNALAPDMYEAVSEALTQADADDNIRLVYLTGTQDSFTAGNDLTTFIDNPNSDAALRFIKAISVTETPIVAAVNGLAVGVGVTMLLHCDLVYAVESAKFNFAFIDLGIVPEAASSLLVPAMVGHRRAAELLMLGEKFDANTAQEIGLVNKVLSADELEDVAWAMLKTRHKTTHSFAPNKNAPQAWASEAVAETIDYELGIFAERIASEETRAIMQAILERRK